MGKRLYGTSLLQHLASLDILRPNLSLAHSVWIEPADIELFATTGATPVHNPASKSASRSGLASVREFLSGGVDIALGTDGAASNDGQNMFDGLRLVGLIHTKPALTSTNG